MKTYIFLDFETLSTTDLELAGAYKYSKGEHTGVLILSWKLHGEKTIHRWIPFRPYLEIQDPVPPIPRIFFDPDIVFVAHNAFFEQCIWRHIMVPKYGAPELPSERWLCTAALARINGVPGKLEQTAEFLKLPVEKDLKGKKIMMKLSKPRKPKKSESLDPGPFWHTKKEDYFQLYSYCDTDVEVTEQIFDRLPVMSDFERKVWLVDQKINFQGVRADREAVSKIIKVIERNTEIQEALLKEKTNGQVEDVRALDKLKTYCAIKGFDTGGSLAKENLEILLSKQDLPEDIEFALRLRQDLGKSSVAKYIRIMERMGADDDRVRDNLIYALAAPTARWAGAGIQLQNLPRPVGLDIDFEKTIADLKSLTSEKFIQKYADYGINTVGAELIRSMFLPESGKLYNVADFAKIEFCVVAWLCEDYNTVHAINNHELIYEAMAAEIYGIPLSQVTKEQRNLGKQAVLGCGYQMGGEKFQATCAKYGIIISTEMAEHVVATFRRKYFLVKQFWYDCQNAAIRAIENPGLVTRAKKLAFCMSKDGSHLQLRIPSGRMLRYWYPGLSPHPKFNSTQISYLSRNSITKKIERTFTYGGRIVENATQATARDINAEAIVRLDEKGANVILSVHDENIGESGSMGLDEFVSIMTEVPKWAEGCPIEAEGKQLTRYRKI